MSDRNADRTDWKRLKTATDEQVEAAAKTDPDNLPLTDEQLAAAKRASPDVRALRSRLGMTQGAVRPRLPAAHRHREGLGAGPVPSGRPGTGVADGDRARAQRRTTGAWFVRGCGRIKVAPQRRHPSSLSASEGTAFLTEGMVIMTMPLSGGDRKPSRGPREGLGPAGSSQAGPCLSGATDGEGRSVRKIAHALVVVPRDLRLCLPESVS